MQYFFSTGEASGELSAVVLARAIAEHDPHATFEGIGAQRMRDAGFTMWRDHRGWASLGPLAALPRIPKLYATMRKTADHLARVRPDLVILVDFGAFNVRLARQLKEQLDFEPPILDIFPPSTWIDRESVARAISSVAVPVTAFRHQYEFYKSLDLPICYFGHPLIGEYPLREPRATPASDAGTIGLLPGSRMGEVQRHLPILLATVERLRRTRPNLRAIIGAADPEIERRVARAARRARMNVEIGNGIDAIADVDAVAVASGTAVLQTALMGSPSVALYVISPLLERYARSIYSGRFYTLPNLVCEREIVPECVQDAATPQRLATELEALLRDPKTAVASLQTFRERLGPPNALDELARFAVALARAGRR